MSRRYTPRAPLLDIGEILKWADAHYARTGDWPTIDAGRIPEVPWDTWRRVHWALYEGYRGLPGGNTLPGLLVRERGARRHLYQPRLTKKQVLEWVDAHYERRGEWPTKDSGPVAEAPEETWMAIDVALVAGTRGFPGGSSLPRLLAKCRGVRNIRALPPFTEEQILAWADAHRARTGRWPVIDSGAIAGAPGESWHAVHHALASGRRGLPGGSSLPRLLAERRGARNHLGLPPLTEEQILEWADRHHARTGRWPQTGSGPVAEAPGETWSAVNAALHMGYRGLPRGLTLARLLAQHRNVVNTRSLACPPGTKPARWARIQAATADQAPREGHARLPAPLVNTRPAAAR